MMSKTHIAIGVAAALTAAVFCGNLSQASVYLAVFGGAAGSMIPDIDAGNEKQRKDAVHGRIITLIVFAAVLYLDRITGTEIVKNIINRADDNLIEGLILLTFIAVGMKLSSHRGFSHSLAALLMLGLSVNLISPALMPYFVIGFVSHILLDLTNKKAVRLFFPFGSGSCMKLFYADRTANRLFLVIGLLWLTSLTAWLAAR